MQSGWEYGEVVPTVEDEDELLRYRAVIEVPDALMQDAQSDPLRETLGQVVISLRDSQSATAAPA
jgi:hypothetical protein